MRTPLLAIWLCLPLAAWAYHEGPGQDQAQLDKVDTCLVAAKQAAVDEDWATAIEQYEAALKDLPEESKDAARRVRLALNQARMMHKQLPKAREELGALLKELSDDDKADPVFVDSVRDAVANSQYYIAWLMRLEGYQRQQWEPEIEAARQTYRLLAERADARGDDKKATRHREDLESSIMLARMELEDLQGLPLPGQ